MARPNQPAQPDLFGVTQKRAQARQAMAARNKADREAGVQPVQPPLPGVLDAEDGAEG